MLQALLNVPAKILLSIAGSLFALNFATYATMKYQAPDESIAIIESGPRCETIDLRVHQLELTESKVRLLQEQARLEAEQARLQTLQGLLNDSAIDAEVAELRSRIAKLRAEERDLSPRVNVIRIN